MGNRASGHWGYAASPMAPSTVLHVLGTRPNFVKMAPVVEAIAGRLPATRQVLVHTGQHYDRMMSEVFFEELGMPHPDHTLEVGSGTHAEQTARVMERIEPVLESERPDLVLVPGDVNSSLAAALTAAKIGIPVGHVESGLRSGDRTMPEELNRILVDHLAELLFTHSEEADLNLAAEGVDPSSVHLVGNTMIDTLVRLEDRFRAIATATAMGLEPGGFLLVTLHRPALVDGPLLGETLAALGQISADLPVVFPVHPRTRAMINGAEQLLHQERGAGVGGRPPRAVPHRQLGAWPGLALWTRGHAERGHPGGGHPRGGHPG